VHFAQCLNKGKSGNGHEAKMQQQGAHKGSSLLAGDAGDGDALWRLIWLVFLSGDPPRDPRSSSP